MTKSRVVFGEGVVTQGEQGVAVHTNIYIGGRSEVVLEKQRAMTKRPLLKTDIPNELWRAGMGQYLLREDGAILSERVPIEIGFVQQDGTVAWTQC